jgi:medium-chain acyl-[acyl-carrier-protein] hydrolase
MTMEKMFTQKLNLPYSAIGANGQVRMDRLLNMFQDAAAMQCDQFGISGFDMAKKQLKWVVSRYQVQTYENPEWLAPLELKTWRSPWKNLYELRHFSIVNPAGVEMISALGIWILVKANTSKPVRLSPHLPEALMTPATTCPELVKNDHDFDEFDHEAEFKIRAHDLDLNQHVNNTVYTQWAMEALPPDILIEFMPINCNVSFLKESFYPGKIISGVKIDRQGDTLVSRHSIYLKETRMKLTNLTMTWKKIKNGR